MPLSEGISPVQGADRRSLTAVLKSVAKMDHVRTGVTLLNQKFNPSLLKTEEGLDKFVQLIRTYFRSRVPFAFGGKGPHPLPVAAAEGRRKTPTVRPSPRAAQRRRGGGRGRGNPWGRRTNSAR